MGTYKEIVTKAVIGKGKKNYQNEYIVTPENIPSTVLGCWVINHNFKGYPTDGKIRIDGSFDVNIWYSTSNDTKTNVYSKTITYSEENNVNNINSDTEVIVRSLKQPTVSKVDVVGNDIKFIIDKELGIELIGETKARVMVEDDDDVWENMNSVDDEIDMSINENYME